MTYDFDSIMSAPLTPEAPPVPTSAPEVAAPPVYDFDKIMGTPSAPEGIDKSAALFEASFSNPTEEAKKKNLSATIQRMSGEYVAPSIMDPVESARNARRLEADHATRASPRTSKFLSNAENAKIAMDDAKVLAMIETAATGLGRGAANLPGQFASMAGALVDVAGTPFGLRSELGSMGRDWKQGVDALLPPSKQKGILPEGWAAGFESLGANLPLVLGAAATGPAAIPAVLGLMSFASGGASVQKAQEQGAGPYRTAALGVTDAVAEYWTEKIGVKYLMDIPGLKNAFLKTAAKFAGAEMVGEQVATVWQDFNEWALLNPEKTLTEFGDERLHAAAVTALATVIGGGGQVAVMKGVSHILGGQQAQANGSQLLELAAAVAESETRRIHAPTFDAFFQDVTDGATVFIDPDKLTEALAESKLDIATVLPTAAAAMANREFVGTGIEIPVAELISGLAGTGFEQAVIEHVRKDPDAMTIAEANKPIDDQMALYQEAVEKALNTGERTAQFNTEVQQIQDDIAAELDATGVYSPTANKTQARALGAFYAVLAEKRGVTPLQLRDGWTDADGVHKGQRLRIRGGATPVATTPVAFGVPVRIGGRDPKTVTYASLRDGRLTRTIAYPDGTTQTEMFAATKDEVDAGLGEGAWVGTAVYENGNYFPVQYKPADALRAAREDAAAIGGGVATQQADTLSQGFDHGDAMLNVGLDVGATDRTQKIDADFVRAELEKMGVQVLSGKEVEGEYELDGKMVKELTYVPRLSRPLTEAEVNQLAVATGQEAIGHYVNGEGNLWGPNAAAWGAFNPEFFKDQAGTKLSDAQQALAQAMSSRRPTAKRAPEDHLGEVPLTVDYTKIEPAKNDQNMALVAQYPGIRFKARKGAGRAEEFIQHITNNLLWLHDQIPADIRQRSKLWYDGARAITDRWTAKYGKSDSQIAAVLAVYSPQKDWFMNVSLAERTLDIVQNQQDTPWSPEMAAVADAVLADEKFSLLRGAIEGKKLSELTDKLEQAAWLRTFDEAHNNRGHRLVTPEGGFVEYAVSTKNVEKKTGWPGFGTIIKALYILEDGRPETIDRALGGEHKVRSFYNNIFHPNSDLGFVTIDTHAVAAGLLRPLSGNSLEVSHNFGSAGTAVSAATGMSGTYAYYQEAYRRAAEARGLLPREMQSVTWEAVRELYTMGFKHDKAKMAVVDKFWSEYEKGKRDLESVRAGILNLAGGVEQPAWVGHDSGISPEGWASSYTGELLGDSVSGRDTGTVDAGTGERAAAGVPGDRLYQSSPAVRAGAVSGPVTGIHFSKEPRDILASSMWGTGMKGGEGDSVRAAKDKRLRHRVAFYVNTGNGITPESGVGGQAHVATLTNLYDADADTLKIWRNNDDARDRESAVLDAGFDGFLSRSFGSQGAVVLLGQRAVGVEHMGGYARSAWDLPKETIKAAIAAGNAVNTGKHINDLQSGFNNASPEAQAAALATVLERFGKPNDAKTVAGFLEGRTGTEALAAILAEQDVRKMVQDRAAVVPPAELPPAKQAAQALMANKQLISGQQDLAGWQKDVARIVPDIADQIDWSKLDSDKLYRKDDIAKTLWAMADGKKRGSFSPATMDLRLLADANLSTFLHEASHFFLAAYTDMASQPGAPQALVDEVNALLGHLFSTVQGGAVAGGDLAQKGGAGETADMFAKDFATKRTTITDTVVVSTKGDTEKVKRSNVNSEGRQISNTVSGLRRFWDWYAGSPEDINGKPILLYHSTAGDITTFETMRETTNTGMFGVPFTSRRAGVFLTPNARFAESYSEGKSGSNTMQVYARMQNPADFRHGMTVDLERALEANGINPRAVRNLQYDWEMFEDEYGGPELVAALKAAGYDGAIINEDDEQGRAQDTYVAFDAEQIKSATGNRGSWNEADSSILRQNGEVPAPGPLPEGATPLEIWSKMSLDQQRPYHEAWAESGEQYFMTGKAPSLALDSVFRTFANWLKRIYGSLKEFVAQNTGGKIHPTTAAFFDRMLATEAEIQQANEARGYVQLFKDAAEAGMTENGWAAYLAMGDEQREDAESMLRARSLRDMKWLQNARTKIIGAMQKEAETLRKAAREQVATELAATPLRQAVKWLKKGEMTQADGTELKVTEGHKLQMSGIEEIFPAGALTPRPDLSPLRGMTAKEGLAPDLVAEMFGLTSGEALVRDLLEMKPFKEEVEELTDLRMLQDHSELIDPDAIARAADEAIHNDARTRMVATELAALAKGVGSPASLMKAAKEYAKQLIETKTSKTLKPWSFAAAETRASKAALTALRKGKREDAATQKRLELLNHVATKQAYEAEAEVKKIIDRFKKIAGYKDDSSAFKSRDAELVNAVRAILADFGIGAKGKSAREYLSVVTQHNPDLAAVLSDTIDAVSANAKDWRDLKISEVRDLAEEVEGLWFLAKRSKQIEIDGKMITLHEAQQAIYDRLDEIGIPDRVPGEGSAVTAAEKRSIMFDRFIGALRRVESWAGAKDGALTGPFRSFMWNPIRDAADAYRADKVKYLKAYRDLLAPIAPSLTRRLIEAPEIGYTFGKDEGGMGKIELLHAILHTGNESNKRKLLLGRGWATENADGTLDTTKWDAFLQKMHDDGILTKADYEFAQGVWNLLESMKPLAQKAHRDVFGKYFAEVTANEFTNQFGTFAGGYVPAMTDPLIVRDAELNKLREGEEGNMSYAFPTTAKGFTKSRVDYNKPLKLDLRTLAQHIDKVLLFSHMTRPVNDVRRVMSGKSVAQALGRVDPQAYNTVIMPWLNRAAKQVVETPTPGREGLGRFWSVVRSRAGMSAMFANVANSVQQITGISLAAVRVPPSMLMHSMAQYMAAPAAFAENVTMKSQYMTTRIENEVSVMSTQINEILLNPSVYESAKEWTSKHAYFMQSAVDNVIGPVVWTAGYNQAIEAGLSEADAVRAGDSIVRETQGSQAAEDVAAFETGSAFYRMFVQFAGYFNMNANLLGTEYVKLTRDMGLKAGAGRGLYVLTVGLAAPAIVGELIMQLFKGGPDDEDKDGEYLDDWLTAILGYGVLRYVTAMVPGIGPAINATVNTLNNKPYDDRISTAPAVSMVESAVKAPINVYKAIVEDGKPSRAVKDVATLISMSVGVPAYAAGRPISYWADVAADRVEPTSAPDAIRGTITGTASPDSKQ